MTLKFYLTQVRMAIIKNRNNNNTTNKRTETTPNGEDLGGKEPLMLVGYKLVQPLWKAI
jgi:hypothetical protein